MSLQLRLLLFLFFFFNHTATTEIYTLSLQTLFRSGQVVDAMYSSLLGGVANEIEPAGYHLLAMMQTRHDPVREDRKSTRLNSSHGYISYAVFCLKKKKNQTRSYLISHSCAD